MIRPFLPYMLLALALAAQTPALTMACQAPTNSAGEYLVSSFAQLQQIGLTCPLNGTYRFTANITAPEGSNFVPIGSGETPFTGKLFGAGYVISNLVINATSSNNIGLFSYTSGATIDSLGLVNATITGDTNVGSLVGVATGTQINHVFMTGRVTGASVVGGLLGKNNFGALTNSNAAGQITGDSCVGGLVGLVKGANLNNDFAIGTINGRIALGGLTGINSGVVATSFALGSVMGTSNIGGLAGMNQGVISTSYANNTVAGETNAGALIGYGFADTVWRSFASTMSSHFLIGGNSGYEDLDTISRILSVSELSDTANYLNWDFTNQWRMGLDAPMLQSTFTSQDARTCPLSTDANGVHSISTLSDLQQIGVTCSMTSEYKMTADIDVPQGTLFTPIGSRAIPFRGALFGQGHTIHNLVINLPNATDVGLFACSQGSMIDSVGLENVSITGKTNVGAFVGHMDNASIQSTQSTGVVSGHTNVGGLVGYSLGEVEYSTSTISVTGSDYVGGLVGNNSGAILHCNDSSSVRGDSIVGGLMGGGSGTTQISYAAGSVKGNKYVGGIAGTNKNAVVNCFATASVTGGSYVGGLLGLSELNAQVVESYATGSVIGDSIVGGLIGLNHFAVINSYATGSAKGISSVGGLVGVNQGSLKNTYATGVDSGTINVGGLVGANYATITSSYASGDLVLLGSNAESGAQVTNSRTFSAQEMLDSTNFINWDFAHTWMIGTSAPLLRYDAAVFSPTLFSAKPRTSQASISFANSILNFSNLHGNTSIFNIHGNQVANFVAQGSGAYSLNLPAGFYLLKSANTNAKFVVGAR